MYTNFWSGYECLNDLGYSHLTVNHIKNFVDLSSKVYTNTTEGRCLQLKEQYQ